MIFLDTSYLLALVRPRDTLHARARSWSTGVREPLLTTEYVLLEVVNALSAPLDRPKAHALIRELVASPDCEIVPASSELWQHGLALHAAQSDKEWSLTDCISFHLMQQRGVTRALAHDPHFEQAGFEALLQRNPE